VTRDIGWFMKEIDASVLRVFSLLFFEQLPLESD
jgi:hypothetical protein